MYAYYPQVDPESTSGGLLDGGDDGGAMDLPSAMRDTDEFRYAYMGHMSQLHTHTHIYAYKQYINIYIYYIYNIYIY